MNLFAECIHIFNIKLRAVVENDLAAPKSVNLMCFHTEQVERKHVCIVGIEQGLANLAAGKYQKGESIEKIADDLLMSTSEVEKLLNHQKEA